MAAQSQILAANATAVQISGDGNSVRIIHAGAELSLSRLHKRREKPQTTIDLLRTDVRATTFVGRAAQCRQLAEWRASPQSIAVLCFTGVAGAGKTRLAIEACETAEAEGWAAGFARSEELARFHATQNLVHWALDRDTLIVIDYAATSLALLKSWFAAIAPERIREGHKLRILLLERQGDPENGWWADLNRRDSADRAGPADLIGHDALHPSSTTGSHPRPPRPPRRNHAQGRPLARPARPRADAACARGRCLVRQASRRRPYRQ
jgi:hypothetical protein